MVEMMTDSIPERFFTSICIAYSELGVKKNYIFSKLALLGPRSKKTIESIPHQPKNTESLRRSLQNKLKKYSPKTFDFKRYR